jgi:hypothetical protein
MKSAHYYGHYLLAQNMQFLFDFIYYLSTDFYREDFNRVLYYNETLGGLFPEQNSD